jgi:paraquat-inducible protein B
VSKKIKTITIGLFIVTGVALGVAGVLLFSSFKIFSRTVECIAYFDETLNGLSEGAPVKYRGVTIGSVKRVMVRFNQAPTDYAMPVILELDENLLRERLGDDSLEDFTANSLEQRVREGLRASLQSESLVTGVLYIGLRPSTNAVAPVFHQLKKRYPELPTEPTQIQQLMSNLASLDVKGIETNLNGLIVKIDTTVGGLRLPEIIAGVTNLVRSVDRLVSSSEITNGLVALKLTLDQYRVLGEKLNGRIDPLADSLTNSLLQAERALVQFRGAAENLRILVAPDAPLPNDLDRTLQQLSGAMQSLSVLLDFLKQHPNALITGREKPDKKP